VGFGEVRYYFRMDDPAGGSLGRAFAVISTYTPRNEDVFRRSYGTVWLTTHSGSTDIKVVELKNIRSVVGMVPIIVPNMPSTLDGNTFFVVEKLGLEMEYMSGYEQPIAEDNEDVLP
jgi:hypothetical protein